MDVTLLYIDGCPSWRTADARLADALDRLRRHDVVVTHRRVASVAEADELTFRGSPTILVDGRDPFADPDAPAGLACRVYRSRDGLGGAPTVEQLVEALGG